MSLPPVTVKTTKIDWNKNQGYFFKKTKDWDISNNVVFYPYRAGTDAIRLAFNSRDFCIAAKNLVLACVLFVPVAGAIVRPIVSKVGSQVGHRDLNQQFTAVEYRLASYENFMLKYLAAPMAIGKQRLSRVYYSENNCMCARVKDIVMGSLEMIPVLGIIPASADYLINGWMLAPKAAPKLDLVEKDHLFAKIIKAHHWNTEGILCDDKGEEILVQCRTDEQLLLAYTKGGTLIDTETDNQYNSGSHELIGDQS